MGTQSRVYVVVTDAAGGLVACRYLDTDDVPGWLATTVGSESVRCDVYDDAPARGGTKLKAFVLSGLGWREQAL
jgi:hypothetical protein